jgi:MurNAc alpha-1-phosphate uridylyltransferase
MDCLLLLAPVAETVGYDGRGDFFMDESGRLSRRSGEAAGLVYIGGYLVHPRIFAGAPAGKFSMNLLWDKAIAQGRLYGLVHEGTWFHVGTPDAIGEAERRLGA